MKTITGSVNTDNYLINFLHQEDIGNLLRTCKNINENLSKAKLVIQLKEFIKTQKKRYIALTLIDWAAKNGYLEIIQWLANNYSI